MSGPMDDLPFKRRLRLAISDPGAITPRAKVRDAESESVSEWQARAVEVVLAIDWKAVESSREAIRSELIRQHLSGGCGAVLYRATDTDERGPYVVYVGPITGDQRIVLHEGESLTLNINAVDGVAQGVVLPADV